jgi:hypothetical protein
LSTLDISSHTRLLQADNVRDICHIDPTFQLKAGLALGIKGGLVFVHHEFSLLLVRIDVFAAQKDAFKQVDMILNQSSQLCTKF